jgi:hypothetical protein
MYDAGKHSVALESTDSMEARSDMYGLGFSRHCSQSHSSQQQMLPCHFQKAFMGNVDLSFSGWKSVAWKQRG